MIVAYNFNLQLQIHRPNFLWRRWPIPARVDVTGSQLQTAIVHWQAEKDRLRAFGVGSGDPFCFVVCVWPPGTVVSARCCWASSSTGRQRPGIGSESETVGHLSEPSWTITWTMLWFKTARTGDRPIRYRFQVYMGESVGVGRPTFERYSESKVCRSDRGFNRFRLIGRSVKSQYGEAHERSAPSAENESVNLSLI